MISATLMDRNGEPPHLPLLPRKALHPEHTKRHISHALVGQVHGDAQVALQGRHRSGALLDTCLQRLLLLGCPLLCICVVRLALQSMVGIFSAAWHVVINGRVALLIGRPLPLPGMWQVLPPVVTAAARAELTGAGLGAAAVSTALQMRSPHHQLCCGDRRLSSSCHVFAGERRHWPLSTRCRHNPGGMRRPRCGAAHGIPQAASSFL